MTESDDKPSAKNLENVITIEREQLNTCLDIEQKVVETMQKRLADSAIKLAQSAYLEALSDGTATIDLDKNGNCGIFGAETGKRDPFHWACSTLHDPHYQALLDGKDPGQTNVQTQWGFTKGILSTMAEGLYAVVAGPFYILLGAWIGGTLRFTQLQRKNAAKRGEKYPSNSPED